MNSFFVSSDLGGRKMGTSSKKSRKVEESESNSEFENDEILNEMSDDVSFSLLKSLMGTYMVLSLIFFVSNILQMINVLWFA